MKLNVTPQQLAESPQLQQLATFFLLSGGRIDRDRSTGLCSYVLDDIGEMLLTADHLALLYSAGVGVDKATLHVEMLQAEYEEGIVPAQFPGAVSVTADEDGEETTITRTWQEYSPLAQESTDGTKYLVRCVHVPPGSTSGNGLSEEEFRIWYAEFGARLLVKAQAVALNDYTG